MEQQLEELERQEVEEVWVGSFQHLLIFWRWRTTRAFCVSTWWLPWMEWSLTRLTRRKSRWREGHNSERNISCYHNSDKIMQNVLFQQALESLCSYLPKSLSSQCNTFVDTYTDVIIDMLTKVELVLPYWLPVFRMSSLRWSVQTSGCATTS